MSYPPPQGGYGGYPPGAGYPPQGYAPQPGPGAGGGIGFEGLAGGGPGGISMPTPQSAGIANVHQGYPPAAQGYPPASQGYPPAPGGGYPPPQGGGYPPPPGGSAYPPAGGYGGGPPPQGGGYGAPAYPAYPGSGPPPPPAGGAPYHPPPPHGGYGPPPPQQGGGYPQSQAPYGGAPQQPPYGAPPQQQGYGAPPQQAAYGAQPPPAAPYGQQPPAAQHQGPAAASYGGGHQQPPPPGAQQLYGGQQQQHAGGSSDLTKKMKSMSIRGQGTVTGKHPFDAAREAEIVRSAMKGAGTDEKAIIDVLGYCTNEQRREVQSTFKQLYGKDIIKDLRSELGGKFERIIIGLFDMPAIYDAKQLHNAISGIGTDEDVLTEILCSRTNSEIKAIRVEYKRMFGKELEKAVMSDTSGHFKRLLVSMTNAARDESVNVNEAKANEDAQSLYKAGEKRWGTDESQFNAVMAQRSYAHLRRVFYHYQNIKGHTIEQAINNEMSGDVCKGMLTIVKVVNSPSVYFAEKLYKSMKGLGTDDDTLMRVVISRCEVDMVQIKQEFQRQYGNSLGQFIKDDISGDYKRVILALCGEARGGH